MLMGQLLLLRGTRDQENVRQAFSLVRVTFEAVSHMQNVVCVRVEFFACLIAHALKFCAHACVCVCVYACMSVCVGTHSELATGKSPFVSEDFAWCIFFSLFVCVCV